MGSKKSKKEVIEKSKIIKKPTKKFVIISVAILAFLAVSVGVVCLIVKPKENVFENLAVFEDGIYYLNKVNKDISFDIIPNKKGNTKVFTLTDENGNDVGVKTEVREGFITIKAPAKSYIEGATYILTLNDAKFKAEELKDVKALTFSIDKEEIVKYEYKKNKTIKEKDIKITTKDDKTTIKTDGKKYKVNDIILVEDKDIVDAYKVTEVNGDNVSVTTPLLSEIYEELEIYQEYEIDYTKIKIDKEVEEQVQIAFEKSSLFQFLVKEVKADLTSKIELKPTKNGLTMEITIVCLPNGKDNLGIAALSDHQIIIKLIYEFSCKPTLDVNLPKKIDVTTAVTQSLEFSIEIKPEEEILNGIKDLTEEEYNKAVMDIVTKLSKVEYDKSTSTADLVTIPINTNVPGVTFNIDLFAVSNFNFAVDFTLNHKASTTTIVGLLITKDGCKPYHKEKKEETEETLIKITGKTEMEFGIGLDIGLVFVNEKIAYAKINTETGLYGSAFITYPIIHTKDEETIIQEDNFVGGLEAGIFIRCKFDAKLDLLLVEVRATKELLNKKIPFIKIGDDTVVTGISSSKDSVKVSGGSIIVPTFTKTVYKLLDNETEKQKIDISKLKFYNSKNEELIPEDNKISIDISDTITVVYTENGKEHKTTFKVNKNVATSKLVCGGYYDIRLYFGVYEVETQDWMVTNDSGTLTINSDGTVIFKGIESGKKVSRSGTWTTDCGQMAGVYFTWSQGDYDDKYENGGLVGTDNHSSKDISGKHYYKYKHS